MDFARLTLTCALLALAGTAGAARCIDEGAEIEASPGEAFLPDVTGPRARLAEMVAEALQRSQSLGATKLLALAALDDVDEVRAGKDFQAGVSVGLGSTANNTNGYTSTRPVEARGSLNVSKLLYDGGRTDRLTDWRVQLAEAARFGQLSEEEQITVNTVALALQRSRVRQHVVVYGQYVRRMACLVESLEAVVRSDRGRASELVQAQKSLKQAELAQAQAQSEVRQVEVRLRRLVGDGLPSADGLSSVLLQVPPLQELVADTERSSEIADLAARAAAADKYADAVAAGNKPQVSFAFGGNAAGGPGSNGGYFGVNKASAFALGVNVNIPLLNPGVAPASAAARKRAQAAALQRADALEARRYRVAEMYEQTQSSFDRARRAAAVLRDSEQVRNFTLQQWKNLGRRSLFDVMGAESDHFNLRIAYVNALADGQQLNAVLLSLGRGVGAWLR